MLTKLTYCEFLDMNHYDQFVCYFGVAPTLILLYQKHYCPEMTKKN